MSDYTMTTRLNDNEQKDNDPGGNKGIYFLKRAVRLSGIGGWVWRKESEEYRQRIVEHLAA